MFAKITVLAIVLPTLASALTLDTPIGLTSGGEATFVWTTEAGDPSTFALDITNAQLRTSLAIANNVQSSLNSLTIKFPIVPASNNYVAEAVSPDDINIIYATSGEFAISQAATSS
ncbi:hypothetical protein SERLA73DRAFT_191908 [Serpula lacrymans var. lacrymans S7.3]|uniref:Uncharacterized protein n=1 Tax=Serpula lacrymans var. lacrymans (strain S7.3) TaxID=936435 RepID=F8QIK3_SERL3|nr:hypothetical protein SERLA73DRAFT_191908 [Serpula lacrymans var. lacrymans S7.3]